MNVRRLSVNQRPSNWHILSMPVFVHSCKTFWRPGHGSVVCAACVYARRWKAYTTVHWRGNAPHLRGKLSSGLKGQERGVRELTRADPPGEVGEHALCSLWTWRGLWGAALA